MAIAIFASLEGENLEDVANRLFQQWRLGRKGLDTGVLLVVFVEDRKLRLEVGYGLEATIPDAVAGQIIREAVAPRFREQRWSAGVEAAVDAVYARIESAAGAVPSGRARGRSGAAGQLPLLFFLVLVALIVGGLALEASRQRHGVTVGRQGWRRTHGGWPGWYGGGWRGGGWSGGGGFSGSGFSGGGGSSGGGGASGSW